jgi:hypothetical protein
MSAPSNWTFPLMRGHAPTIVRASVDLPAPVGPMMPRPVPGGTAKFML